MRAAALTFAGLAVSLVGGVLPARPAEQARLSGVTEPFPLADCGSMPAGAGTRTPSGSRWRHVSLAVFGAVADGVTDNRDRIQKALDYGAAHRMAVFVPAGRFAYSGTLTARGIPVFGTGRASMLVALDGGHESLILTGRGGCVADLQMIGTGTTRLSTPWSDLIWARSARDYTVRNVLIKGSSNGGIFNEKSTNGHILHNTIEDTLADSITSIDGASNIVIRGNRIVNSGDDGISVVSYADVPIVHDIRIQGNMVLHNKSGRGISVVGGDHVEIVGNYVAGGQADAASVYIAAESEWGTRGVNDVLVSGNTLVDGGGDPSGTGQGAITVYNSQGGAYVLANVVLRGNQIIDPRSEAFQFVGNGSEAVLAEDNSVYTAGGTLTSEGNPRARVTMSGNKLLPSGRPVPPVAAGGSGK